MAFRQTAAMVVAFLGATASCSHGAGDGEIDAAVARCVAAHQQTARNGKSDLRSMANGLIVGCADLYQQKRCRDSWKSFPDRESDEKLSVALLECRVAYCELLPAPKPEACRTDAPFAPNERGELWAGLQHAIFVHDLGEERAALVEKLAVFTTVSVPVDLPPAEPLEPAPTICIDITPFTDGGNDIRATECTGQQKQGKPLFEARFRNGDLAWQAGLTAALERRGSGTRVVIAAAAGIEHGSVVAVLDAVRQAGISKFAIDIENREAASGPPASTSTPASQSQAAVTPSDEQSEEPTGPKVEVARPTVHGSLDDEAVKGVVGSHVDEIRNCYVEFGLSRRPGLVGDVDIYFVIGGGGEVMMSAVSHSTLHRWKVENCIAEAFRDWKFTRPEGGGIAVVTQTIRLAP